MAQHLVLEVRCLATAELDVLTPDEAALRSGVPLHELVEALNRYGGCETDGYAIVVHPVLHAYA